MIKINLANTILKNSDSSGSLVSNDSKSLRDSAIKVVLILVPTIGLMYYEKTDLEQKNLQLQQLTLQRDKINEDLQSKGSVDEIVKLVEQQQQEMELKINVMEKIFGLREKKLQALSMLQKHILPSLWLTKLLVSAEGQEYDQSGATIVKVSGLGTAVDDIQLFAKSLSQEKAVFRSVKSPNIISQESGKSDLIEFKFEIILQD